MSGLEVLKCCFLNTCDRINYLNMPDKNCCCEVVHPLTTPEGININHTMAVVDIITDNNFHRQLPLSRGHSSCCSVCCMRHYHWDSLFNTSLSRALAREVADKWSILLVPRCLPHSRNGVVAVAIICNHSAA